MYPKSDPEDAQRKRDALQAQLVDGIDALATSDEWTRYLDIQKRFHNYSFGNSLLIMLQFPDATRVMPYGTRDKKSGKPLSGWLSVGRHVKGPDPATGEKQRGIAIWAPNTRMVERTDANGNTVRDANGKTVKRERVTGWRIAYVFDVSQTEGEPLPEVTSLLAGEDDLGLYDHLAKVAGILGFTVTMGDLGHVNGCTSFDPDVITINPARSPRQHVKTMAHELAHAILHRDVDYGACRGKCELEAESVAYIVCGYLGMSSDDYSLGYVLTWQSGDASKAREQVKASGDAIQRAARKIIDALES